MNLRKIIIFSGFLVMMAVGQVVLAQEEAAAPLDQQAVTYSQQSSSQKETDMQWAWGEVTDLDSQAKTVTLKYLDYETDQEKELVLAVDEKTIFENIKDFNELKINDTLSIDYMIAGDNRNIAKNISFEKPEASSVSDLPQTAAPELAQPAAIPADSTIAANEAPLSAEPTLATPLSVEPVSAESEPEPVPVVGDQVK